jgi:hypothetical protein
MTISPSSSHETYRITALRKTTQSQSSESDFQSHYQQGGRHYLVDPDTDEQVSISRLTAYAEYGELIHERVAHHEIPLLKIDAPKFLDAPTREDHTQYHRESPNPTEVGGYPVFRLGL